MAVVTGSLGAGLPPTLRRTWRRCGEHCCGESDRSGSNNELKKARSSQVQHEVDGWPCKQTQVLVISIWTLHSWQSSHENIQSTIAAS